MKVSISYTVNFDDVPEEVNKLVHRAENILHTHGGGKLNFDELRDAVSKSDFDTAFEQMHEIRTRLADIDTCLSDCNHILEGYLKAKYSQTETQAQDPAPGSAPAQAKNPAMPDGFDMEKELANLKKNSPSHFPKSTKKED
jgi:hypothetical protein